jgi:hypothetical protein
METATMTPAAATTTPTAPAAPAQPVPVAPVPVAAAPTRRPTNWSAIARVGVVSALVLGLVAYAMTVTYQSVVKGGITDRGGHFEVDLKTMSTFEMDQYAGTLQDVPQRYRDLSGKKVLLIGEVAPANDTAGSKVSRFQLCYSVARCCFGGEPKVQHFVDCRVPGGGKVANYDGAGPIKVFGTLHVNVIRANGKVQSVFQLDIDRVEPHT